MNLIIHLLGLELRAFGKSILPNLIPDKDSIMEKDRDLENILNLDRDILLYKARPNLINNIYQNKRTWPGMMTQAFTISALGE